jgi:hypothetical protein
VVFKCQNSVIIQENPTKIFSKTMLMTFSMWFIKYNPMTTQYKPEPALIHGQKIGRLFVGELVANVREHPAFHDTKSSYIKQGRLTECTCDCGKIVLYSWQALKTGRLMSCGCLRQEYKQKAWEKKQARTLLEMSIKEYKNKEEIAKSIFDILYHTPLTSRNEPRLQELAREMKHWKAMRSATRRKLNDLLAR